jgi:hypothetical protein
MPLISLKLCGVVSISGMILVPTKGDNVVPISNTLRMI